MNEEKQKTNHILHLLLSVITGGLWIIPWIVISHNVTVHNRDLGKPPREPWVMYSFLLIFVVMALFIFI